MDTDTTDTSGKDGRTGRALAALTVVALAVAVAVLLIDQQIKRDIINQALAARRLLDEARILAEGSVNGHKQAATDHPVPDSGRGDAGDSVAGSPGVAAQTGSDDRDASRGQGERPAAPRRRARRDGS